MSPQRLLTITAFVLLPGYAPLAGAQTPAAGLAGTNGEVSAIARAGNTIFIAGSFNAVGPVTGGGVPVTRGTGQLLPEYPRVAGTVYTVVSDDRGGWYIGGSFVAVGGLPRHNLAHVLSDGGVAPWNPNPDGDLVTSVAVDGKTIYVSGDFTNIGGRRRSHLAALDAASGDAGPWDPDPNGVIHAMIPRGSTVFVGGEFDSMGGSACRHIAALDARTGAPGRWRADTDGSVGTLDLMGNTLYVGGAFTTIGGQPRGSIAALDATSGAVTSWDPGVSLYPIGGIASVQTLAATPSRVFIGGDFLKAGGQPRGGLAALDRRTGLATDWNPVPISGAPNTLYFALAVDALVVQDHRVYVGGRFAPLCLKEPCRHYLEALDAETAAITDWDPKPNGPVTALALGGDALYVGGTFTGMGDWQRRPGLAAIDATTGQVSPWVPNANLYGYDAPMCLAVAANQVYLGGMFDVNGVPQLGLASFDIVTGALTHPDLRTNRDVLALCANGGTLFVGGDFDSAGGGMHRELAALDAETGLLKAWDPGATGFVEAFALNRGILYIGGWAFSVGGPYRMELLAVDATTAAVMPWNPSVDNEVKALAADGGTVYAGGRFQNVGGVGRNYLAALDARTGAVKDWDPDPTPDPEPPDFAPILALSAQGNVVYAGGNFTSIGSRARNFLAALDASSGRATEWNPDVNGVVEALDTDGATVYVGGRFTRAGLMPAGFFAAIPADRSAAESQANVSVGNTRPMLTLRPPSPMRAGGAIAFTLPEAAPVTLAIFDLQGRRIATLLDRAMEPAGAHEVGIHASGWPAGVYLCRLEAGGQSLARKIVLLK